MDVSHILDPLNEAQRKAVTADPGHLLVLAGAGSGKTRCLAYRVAWLVEAFGYSPYAILAVTFTNKAAAEMRGRIEQLLGISGAGMWVGTFHSLAHRLLRTHWREANLPEHFQILDSDDQYRLVRRVQKSLNIDESRWPPKQAQWFISKKKDEGLRPSHIDPGHDPYTRTMLQIYQAYEEACQVAGLVDFAELLLRAHELWLNNPDLLSHYQERFRYLLVDEFQDTNTLQYAWLKLLAGDKNYMMAVGDDDQSIYRWRGAKIENIHRFEEDFPNTTIIRLEQNYRSSGTILKAANTLITNNVGRLGKELWTDQGDGELISVYSALNEIDEARFITQRIQALLEQQGRSRSEFAVLYRSNAQSRVLEEAFLQMGIPYRVYGGQRFFERAEIKDALGYLRLLGNRDDDAGFERIINMPTRGIGEKTINIIRQCARTKGLSLWRASQELIADNQLPSRAEQALMGFIHLIDDLAELTKHKVLSEQMHEVINGSGLRDHFAKDRSEKGRARLENLDELITATEQFEPADPEQPALLEFLSHAALESGEAQADAYSDCVQLMTLHSAKGLEFPFVFICGMEEKLFPHEMCLDDPVQLEEERRLCYVGITRAREKLFLSYAERRHLYGREHYHRSSRFLGEIPEELLDEIRMRSTILRSKQKSSMKFSTPSENHTGLKMGQRVRHKTFGEGIVVNYEGQGAHARVQVSFERHGDKWLVISYASLETV